MDLSTVEDTVLDSTLTMLSNLTDLISDDLRDFLFFLIVTLLALEKVLVMPFKVAVMGCNESFASI
jgi:hypothetical protein